PAYSCNLFYQCIRDHLDLHSFPTRRSSDLMRDKVIGKINVSYEGLISSRATGEAARNGRYQDDSSRSGITPGLIEFISLDDDPSGISDVQAIRKHPVSAAGQATMRQDRKSVV